MRLKKYSLMNKISTIIVVKNSPKYIFDTINSIKDISDEIIIVDIGIDIVILNEVKNLAMRLNIKIETITNPVPYVELIREEVKKYAKNEWILFLDPDEIIQNKLIDTIKNGLDNYDCFSFPRKNVIFGKWIQNSRWWPDYQTRLFKKSVITWPKIIHHQPIIHGNLYTIAPQEELAILHCNYDNLDQYFEKMIRYAKAEAETLVKQKPSYSLPDAIKSAISEFISRYFAYDGYRDGMHGFVLAILQMLNSFLVYFYYWEVKGYKKIDQQIINNGVHAYFKQFYLEVNHWMIVKKLIKKTETIKARLINILLMR